MTSPVSMVLTSTVYVYVTTHVSLVSVVTCSAVGMGYVMMQDSVSVTLIRASREHSVM